MVFIYKGDDVDFAEKGEIAVSILSMKDLAGFTGRFEFMGVVKNFTTEEIARKAFTFSYTAEETDKFCLGQNFGYFTMFDDKGRKALVSKVLVDVLPASCCEACGANGIVIGFSSAMSYDALTHLPSIDGVVVQGAKTAGEYGLATCGDLEDERDRAIGREDELADRIEELQATFRGTFADWDTVPSEEAGYLGGEVDANDYIIVEDASGYRGRLAARGEGSESSEEPGKIAGTWRFAYVGKWAAEGKGGWHPEYEIGERDVVKTVPQELTAEEQAQVRDNIGIGDVLDSVASIESKIPEAAAADNQLADKAWVEEKVEESQNYEDLSNKPQINGVELSGNKTAADLGLASTADATLTERGPNHDGFSEWIFTPSKFDGDTIKMKYEYGGWQPYTDSYGLLGVRKGDAESTMLTWVEGVDFAIGFTATRTVLPGYQLGSQTDKPLASEAEAEALRTLKADKTYVDAKSSIKSPDGDTVVSADNSGTAKVAHTTYSLGNASVFFPDGFSIQCESDPKYVAPSGGEAIEFFGPIESTAVPDTYFWVPYDYKDTTDFKPSRQSAWFLTGYVTDAIPRWLMFMSGARFDVINWSTSVTPMIDLSNGTVLSGSAPDHLTRALIPSTATKTVATTDQIPSVPAVVPPSTTATAGQAADAKATGDALALVAPEWASGSSYAAYDAVKYNGAYYYAKQAIANSTTAPSSDTTNWVSLANLAAIAKLFLPVVNGTISISGEDEDYSSTKGIFILNPHNKDFVSHLGEHDLYSLMENGGVIDYFGNALVFPTRSATDYRLYKFALSDEIPTSMAWNQITGKPSSFAPSAHKSTHAAGGTDALTPSDIGAVPLASHPTEGNLASLTADGGIQDSGISADSVSGLAHSVSQIESVIPNQASTDNQLADKDFVNSSIATNTATFRGTSDAETLAAFEAWLATIPAENNDYVFWQTEDAEGNTVYKRYKYSAEVDDSSDSDSDSGDEPLLGHWLFEYELNNSSFTAEQWAAINSGITEDAVTKLGGIAAGAQANVIETVKVNGTALTPQDKAVNIPVPTLDNTVTPTSANGVKSSGIWSALWGALASLPTGFASLYDWCVSQLAGKADKSDVDPLLFAQYYPDGSVTSAAEFTAGIKYDDPDTTYRTIAVKPFCNTGTAANDNCDLSGRVVIPPFVDAQGNGYISDDGTRFKVVEVSGGVPHGYSTNLTAVIAPNTVTTIGSGAFRNCSLLASVSLSAATTIRGGAFSDCSALTSVSLPSATSIGGSAFTNCTSLASVSLPSATTIGDYAFRSCTSLASVSTTAATSIGSGAFNGCTSLASVSLPSATSIRVYAFYGCTSLASVDFGATARSSVPTLGSNAFINVPTTCKIIVPDSQYDAWIAASGWSGLVTAGYEFVKHSDWDAPHRYELATKEDKANKITSLSAQSTNTQYPSAKCVWDALAAKLSLTGGLISGSLTLYDSENGASIYFPSGGDASFYFGSGLFSASDRTGKVKIKGADAATVANIAPAFSTSSTYALNALCVYNGVLYRCTTAITTAEAWTEAHWTVATVEDVLEALAEETTPIELSMPDDCFPVKYVVNGETHTVGRDGIVLQNGPNVYLMYDNTTSPSTLLCQFSSSTLQFKMPSSALTSLVFGSEELDPDQGLNWPRLFVVGGAIVRATGISAEWKAGTAYAVPTLALHDGAVYRCIADHTAGAAWDKTKWVPATVQDILDLKADKAEMAGLADQKLDKMVSLTWAQLKAKRDEGTLVPGAQYRITDYVATTNGDMSSQSANHPFDIIVVADSDRKLNEHARAVLHDRDTYFVESNFAAWDVWYCIDNDTSRFAWADATDGKGVVYRLVDEFGNDCPYDFKGIQFQAYGDTDNVWRYTFDSGASANRATPSGDPPDFSLMGWIYSVYGNKIEAYVNGGKRKLNCIVFKGQNCYNNTFGGGCYNTTFGRESYQNNIGDHCYNNVFGILCPYNTLGVGCGNNIFGSYCGYNAFGGGCSDNTFGDTCYHNSFGNDCFNNTFGNECAYNTFGGGSSYNTFGGGFYNVTLGSGCNRIKFGTQDSVKNNCRFIHVANGNQYIYINPTGTTSSSAYYQNVEVKEGVNNTTTYKTITDANVGQTFLTTYKPANSQEISI